jgi:hypothetical protein
MFYPSILDAFGLDPLDLGNNKLMLGPSSRPPGRTGQPRKLPERTAPHRAFAKKGCAVIEIWRGEQKNAKSAHVTAPHTTRPPPTLPVWPT